MSSTFHLESDELDIQFLEALRKLFPNGKQLVITVEQEEDATQFVENRPWLIKQLEESEEQIKRGEVISFENIEELKKALEERWQNEK